MVQIEKEHRESVLMNWTKKRLVEQIMCLEHNNNVLQDTVNTQYENYLKLVADAEQKNNNG